MLYLQIVCLHKNRHHRMASLAAVLAHLQQDQELATPLIERSIEAQQNRCLKQAIHCIYSLLLKVLLLFMFGNSLILIHS